MFHREWLAEVTRCGRLLCGLSEEQQRQVQEDITRYSLLAYLFRPLRKPGKKVEYDAEYRRQQREVVLLLADWRCPICRASKVGSAQYVISKRADVFACVSCHRAGCFASLRAWLENLSLKELQRYAGQ